jgi:hypothetical protein
MFVHFSKRYLSIALPAALLVSLSGPVSAASNFFLGDWKIEKAVVAPWADPANKPDDAEMKSLVGKTVRFKQKQIVGPGTLACKELKYEVVETGADMLFQGGLAEKPDGTKLDADKLAAGLGFQGTSWKTLQTGCENELDFHFVDETTAEFGLNNYVYTLKRK